MTNEFNAARRRGGAQFSLIVLLLLLPFLGYFCKSQKVVIKGPIKAPQGVAFIDVKDRVSNVQNVRVTIIDEGSMVVSSNGIPFKSVQVTGGVMSIGLAPKASFGVEKPYRFFIRAEADGYMTNLQTVIVTEDAPNFLPIFMTKLDALPASGLAAAVGTITSLQGTTLQREETLQAVSVGGKIAPVTVTLPKGVRFLYEDRKGGKRVTAEGPLRFRMLYGASRDSNANRVFPGGFEVSDAYDETGQRVADPANPIYFTTAGWFSLEMNVGNSVVTGFSEPLLVNMPLNKNTINPQTGSAVKIGDNIPLWSMDNRTGVWRTETIVTVEGAADGGLKIRFPIRHLSTFNADWKSTQCSGQIDVNYTYNAANVNGFGGWRYARLENTADGSELKHKLVDFDNTGILHMVRLPAIPNMQLLVHEGSTYIAPLQGITGVLNCPGMGTLAPKASPNGCISLEFVRNTATDANVPIEIQCNNSVWTNSCNPQAPFYFEGIINGDGNVPVPNYGGNRCVRLWFLDNSNASAAVYLDFTINFNIGLNITSLPIAIKKNGVLISDTATYRKEMVPITSTQPCGTRLRVNIPESLITGSGCM